MNLCHLPDDILRIIYDYDPTFKTIFSTSIFKNDLEHRWLSQKEPMFYNLIKQVYMPISKGPLPGVVWDFMHPSFTFYTVHLTEENVIHIPLLLELYMQAGIPCENSIAFEGFICDTQTHKQISETRDDYLLHPQTYTQKPVFYGRPVMEYLYSDHFYPFHFPRFYLWYRVIH